MQFPDSALAKVKIELERIAGSDAIGLYLSIIETGAIRALQQGQQNNTQRHEEILVELNRLVRKFERSLVAEEKIRKELSSLSDDAQTFVRVELAIHHLQRPVTLSSEDWSDPTLLMALKRSVMDARRWVRQSPGGKTATGVHAFCRDVMLVYQQISGKTPGVGGENNVTPFERLWHASLCLPNPNATTLKAREIFRRASFRR